MAVLERGLPRASRPSRKGARMAQTLRVYRAWHTHTAKRLSSRPLRHL
jgi:hypothetical protein